ncbi:MAG TPA: CcmD family protein [Arachidicoccus sp.]
MNIFKKSGLAISLCLISIFSFGQAARNSTAESADFMNSNGKIYVVVAVVLLILIGLFLYLFSLDKKISKLEKESK